MKSIFTYLLCILTTGLLTAQISFNQTVADELVVCGEADTYTFSFTNNYGTSINISEIVLDFPNGIEYVSGSLLETSAYNLQEFNINNLSSIVLKSDYLPDGASIDFSLSLRASYGAIAFQDGGGVFENTITVQHDQGTDANTSLPYNILEAALSITSVSPLSASVFVGETFNRQVTIVNGGYGYLTELVLHDIYNSNLSLDGVDNGVINEAGNAITITDFSMVGDGDNYFEQNESITITEIITANGCNSSQSQLYATWGCDNQTAISNKKYPYTSVTLFSPNLSITPSPSYNTCGDGSADQQSLSFTNNGTGPANDISLDIFQHKDNSNSYSADIFSKIDENSFSYTIDGGTSTPLAVTASETTSNTGGQSCLGASPKGKVTLSLPNIQPGSTLVLTWDSYTCQTDYCGEIDLVGWRYDMDYTDMCFNNTYNKNGVGQASKRKNMIIFPEYPSDLNEGQQGQFNFRLTTADFDFPEGTTPAFEVTFDIPDGMLWEDGASDLQFIGSNSTWTPSSQSYNASTQKLTAQYDFPIPINLLNAEFQLLLRADCATMTSNPVNVGFSFQYLMDTSCPSTPYRWSATCDAQSVTYLHCPSNNCVGMAMNGLEVNRTSFGEPDNDQDGLPDASGSINHSLIMKNRVMVGDTFEVVFGGEIHTNQSYPSWSYGYAKTSIPYGNNITLLNATLSVFDSSSGQTLTCDNVNASSVLNSGNLVVDFDYSVNELLANACNDFNGFVFEDGDQVTLKGNFKVTSNIGNTMELVNIPASEFYVSDIQDPSDAADKYQCNFWSANFTLIGYLWDVYDKNWFSTDDCTRTIHQYYQLRMGNGNPLNNLFPYEYRHWGSLNKVRVEVPEGYAVTNAEFIQRRTQYTSSYVQESVSGLIPLSITPIVGANSYEYDLASLYVNNGGSINLSDDGFYGFVRLTVDPTCTVSQHDYKDLKWFYKFDEADYIGGATTDEVYTSNWDKLRYRRANLSISTNLQTVDGISDIVSWDIKVNNGNIAPAPNSFLTFEETFASVQFLIDLSTNDTIFRNNNIFELGTINKSTTKNYRVFATYSSCQHVPLVTKVGYECEGYPSNVSTFACELFPYTLYVNPQPADLQQRIKISIPEGDVCTQPLEVEVELASVKLSDIYDILVTLNPPSNLSLDLQANSLEVLYPAAGTWTSITDPILSSGTYSITGGDLDSEIGDNGLVGITDITKNIVKFRFKIDINGNYIPGDRMELNINSNRPCGQALPEITLLIDPSATFERLENSPLDDIADNWGMAWGDYDNDGNVDVFITSYEASQPNMLYKNNGDGSFTKQTSGDIVNDLAPSIAASWADYDNDGDLDLYVTNNIGYNNFLYRNEGSGTFTKITNDPIVNDNKYAHGCSWVDVNNDGFLDMYVADYFPTQFNKLYLNNGDGTFTRNTTSSIANIAAHSIAAIWADYDNDGDQDVFIANNDGENNMLYRNDGNTQFTKINTGSIVNDGGKSVGASWGDYNNDGFLDIFVANAGEENNFLYKNNGNGTFTKVTTGHIVTSGGNTHGSAWADFDNDGDLDLVISNDNDGNNTLYSNNGDETFSVVDNNITYDGGNSFGLGWADYDNDLDQDLFIANHTNQTNFLYTNERGKCQSKACIFLEGTNSNASAIGTKIQLKANIYGNDVWQTREISAQTGGGIGGQSELKQLIGLGDANIIDSLVIIWPSGYEQIATNLAVDTCMTIIEVNGSKVCGTAFHDANANCILDPGETLLANQKVTVLSSGRTFYTDEFGYYETQLPVGSHDLLLTPSENWQLGTGCAASLQVNVLELDQTYCDNNYGLEASCPNPDLSITLGNTDFRVGFQSVISITYTNRGTQPSTGTTLTLDLDAYLSATEATLSWDSNTNNLLTWNLNSLGINESNTIYLKVEVSPSAPLDQNLSADASLSGSEGDCYTNDNSYSLVSKTVGAYDPNDILVSPEGYISPQQELTYKIRFQNVGNTTADYVRIENQLPENLDIESLILGATSATYRFRIEEDNRLIWEFENINLPDSTSNEAESHGFVMYRIKPQKDLEAGTVITNDAAIFFDFNAPIITNTVVNIISNRDAAQAGSLFLYPNPMQEKTTIELIPNQSGNDTTMDFLKVFDSSGKLVYSKSGIAANIFVLHRGHLTSGTYLIEATSTTGEKFRSRLIVNH